MKMKENMKINLLKHCAIVLFSYTILNNGVSAEDCALFDLYNDGFLWNPYVTYTPCGEKKEVTIDVLQLGRFFAAEPGTHIKLGPMWTKTLYLDTTPAKGPSRFKIVCAGALGTTAECVRVDEAGFQKYLKQRKKIRKK